MSEVTIGCYGLSGHQIHGSASRLERARLTAMSGIDEETFEKQKEAIGDEVVFYPDIESFLASDVDLVSFCSSRRDEQASQTIQALKAGKHVLAEKPMATNRADLDALAAAVEESGKSLWTMTSMVYYPPIKGLKAVVESGVIGDVVQVYCMKSYPYHDRRPQDRGIDGGIIQAAIHAVSVIGHITGQSFAEIFAQDTGKGNPKDGEFQMAMNMACRLDNGTLAAIVANYCNPRGIGYHGNDQVRFHGTNGMIELVDGSSRRMLVINVEDPREFENDDGDPKYPQDIINSILDGTPTLLTQEDGFRYTEAVIRAHESVEQGRPLGV